MHGFVLADISLLEVCAGKHFPAASFMQAGMTHLVVLCRLVFSYLEFAVEGYEVD